MNTEELFDEQDETMDVAVDINVMIFFISRTLQYWRYPSTNPIHDSKSVCTRPIVGTNNSLDCTNDDEVILSLFQELFGFFSDLE
jgi:hypothetical protein